MAPKLAALLTLTPTFLLPPAGCSSSDTFSVGSNRRTTQDGGADGGTGGTSFTTPDASSNGGGCAKADFLFVVDNSVSMRDHQKALIASFPKFINSIRSTVSTVGDFHVLVADTDAWTRCTPQNCQTGEALTDKLCINAANGYACNTQFEPCDNKLGAGVTHPAGDGASNRPCAITEGNRYLTEKEQDLDGAFACIAQVGLAGAPAERPMNAMVAALADRINGPGGCNEGFLRDDAILVVTFISDDPNYEDTGRPKDWYDAVVAAKNGDAASVVVLGLTPAWDGCGPDNKPDKGAHWAKFLALWGPNALHASVCNVDYATFFDQAVSVVDTACTDFSTPK